MARKRPIDELAQRVYDGDETATEDLYRHGLRFVRWIAKHRNYGLGRMGDFDDLVAEGMVGFWEAVQSWNGQGVFRLWAEFCAVRKFQTAIKKATRQKHALLNKALSLDGPAPPGQNRDGLTTLGEVLSVYMRSDRQEDPSTIIEDAEERMEAHDQVLRFVATLTPLEGQALLLVMRDGLSYKAAAQVLGRSPKAVDNAINRAKRAARKMVQEVSA